ncbi:GNAT family N-acyltransferase [Planktotalea sp.]|uniref:GNAT family N-acetyltransferase n=1 Tax=Planktotalea sp. TaxID=2029877 RepID=UPI0025D692C1|nr:GNAT family N-acyltransferase [Planktotalea sp.]
MAQPDFKVIFANSKADVRVAQTLRYDVFVEELGAVGTCVDHAQRLEQDHWDPHSKHLLLLDCARGGDVATQAVGVYRLLDTVGAKAAGGFYATREFDLTPLLTTQGRVLELGRSCLHRDYRGGTAMFHLWSALAAHVLDEKYDVLFGSASFRGTDMNALSAPLSLLHHRHLAVAHLCPTARMPFMEMGLIAEGALDRKACMTQIPALIKAYLRLGGCVGAGAYLDFDFNTTDVCMILDVAQMNVKQRSLYTQERAQ